MVTIKKAAGQVLALLCIAGLTGCVPPRDKMVKEIRGFTLPADVTMGRGLIYVIYYPTTLVFGSEKDVLLDGEDDSAKVTALSSGTYAYFYVLPGYHCVKMPEWSPYDLVVDVNEGDLLFIRADVDRKTRKNILKQIDGVEGRYYVKHLKPAASISGTDY